MTPVRRVLALLAALAAALAAFGTSPASAATINDPGPPAPGAWLSGVHEGGDAADYRAFGDWRGAPARVVVEIGGTAQWSSIENTPTWLAGKVQGLNAHLVLAMAPVPTADGTATVEKCAARYYDQHYVTAARNLINAGMGSTTIRLAWEQTGDWFKWSQGNSRYFYQSCWRNIVRAFRTVPGGHFTWDFNISDQHVDPTPWYPGDGYVDYVSGDFYDLGTATARWDHAASINAELHGPYAADWVASFARAHGKGLALTEWGVVWKCATARDVAWQGGDDPQYIQAMRDWMAGHRDVLAYESYFDGSDSACHTDVLRSGHFPDSAAAYARLW